MKKAPSISLSMELLLSLDLGVKNLIGVNLGVKHFLHICKCYFFAQKSGQIEEKRPKT